LQTVKSVRRIILYTGRNKRFANKGGIKIVKFPHFLSTLRIPPTWRRGFILSSVTLLHLACSLKLNYFETA